MVVKARGYRGLLSFCSSWHGCDKGTFKREEKSRCVLPFCATSGSSPLTIAPVLIVAQLEEFHYAEATAIAVVLLAVSFVMLIAINLLERWNNIDHR